MVLKLHVLHEHNKFNNNMQNYEKSYVLFIYLTDHIKYVFPRRKCCRTAHELKIVFS